MKFVAMAAFLGMLAFASGCSEQSSPGGPGVSRQPAPTQPSARGTMRTANKPVEENVVTNKNDIFRLMLPNSESFDRGKTQKLTISINRGKDFHQSVKLDFKAPNGVTITPAEPVIQPTQDKVTVSVDVAKDARVEKTSMEVQATPQSGQMVSMPMQIQIK
jgi:uncharacterized membrane protein